MTFKRTAHGYQFLYAAECLSVFLDQCSEIRHRSQRDHRNLFSFQNVSHKIHGSHFLLPTLYFRQKTFAKSIFSMSIQRVHIFTF